MEVVLKYLGNLLLIFAIFPFLPVFVAIHYGESMVPFFAPILVSLALGIWLVRQFSNSDNRFSLSSFDLPRSISLSALSYVVISVIGMLPFLVVLKLPFIDALFESVSGFSTTGLTVLTDVESVPYSLLMWRAETQWIGGVGIVILFLLIVSAMRQQDSLKETTTKAKAVANLYQAQGASEKLEANMAKSMRHTIMIYVGYTLLGILLLSLVGLSFFEATAISFTAISTAGFSVTNVFYTSWPVLLVVSFLMIAGAVSFVVHNRLFKGYVKEVLADRGLRFFLIAIGIAVLGVFAFVHDFKTAFFETVSAFTTTGFSITNIGLLPHFAIMMLMCCMIIGGMIGSTAGGIKIGRFRMMLKSIPWMIKKAVSPSEAIIPMKMDGRVVEEDTLLVTHAFIAAYILVLFIGTGLIIVTGESFLDASFQTVSALGGVGLQTTDVGVFHPLAKSVLIVAMLFGRLEIFPLLVLGKVFYDRISEARMRHEDVGRKLFYIPRLPSEIWKKKS
jgi:trk system potassium uptake protein TrkH